MFRMTTSEKMKELKRALDGCGLTQAWASRQLDITSGYLTLLLKAKANPSEELIRNVEKLTAQLKKSGLIKAVS